MKLLNRKAFHLTCRKLLLLFQFAYVVKKIKSSRSVNDGRILICNTKFDIYFTIVNYYLAKCLANRGYSVVIVYDDGVLTALDNDFKFNFLSENARRKRKKVRKRNSIIKKILFRLAGIKKTTNIEFVSYSDISPEVSQNKLQSLICDFKDQKYNEHIVATHKRYFNGVSIDPLKKDHFDFYKFSAEQYLITESVVNKLIKKYEDIELGLVLDGIYVTWGPVVDVFRSHGKKILFYQHHYGFYDRSFYFGNKHLSINNISPYWHSYLKDSNIKKYKAYAHSFLERRVSGAKDSFSEEEQSIIDSIKSHKKNYKGTISIFPNISWDGAISERDTIFKDPVDWIHQVLNWAKSNRYQVILRDHPQRKDFYTPKNSTAYLLEASGIFLKNFSNVYYVSPLEKVNSIKMALAVSDINVLYNGTLITEFTHLKQPVIISGESPYTSKSVGYEPKNTEEFFTILEKLLTDNVFHPAHCEQFYENNLVAAGYQYYFNIFYLPMAPTLKDGVYDETKFWDDWDLSIDKISPEYNPDVKKTIDRILFEIN